MTKTMSIRFEDRVAALIAQRAERDGISINQAVNQAILDASEADLESVRERAHENMRRYRTVMERLA